MADRYFNKDTFEFLTKLAKNNKREWFENHKKDYETTVRSPAFRFIEDMGDDLAHISPHFLAVAKKVGGSLMRVHRDVRFGKDKRPYKTNIGIQFRHERGKDVHAPGFYVHIEPEECFVGVGIWRPDATALGQIRDRIIEKDKDWETASRDKAFLKHFELRGDSLKNPPRGYDKEHRHINDLKRKDFISVANIADSKVSSKQFRQTVFERFQAAAPYMAFLCKALDLRY